jgi:TonB family protein
MMNPRAVSRSSVNGVLTSCIVHGVVIIAALYFTSTGDTTRSDSPRTAFEVPSHLVWLSGTGIGGSSGSGGDGQQTPARAAEVKGADRVTMPSAPQSPSENVDKPQPEPLPDVPVQTLGASTLTAMGLIEGGAESLSRGSGDGPGAGTDKGSGIGPSAGNRIGAGRGTGIGDVYGPGNGVTMPVPVHQEKPQYTIEAMRARIEGAVVIECVVEPTGLCAKLRVLRSLDSRLGLDQQALRAAAAWRFSPGTRLGKPVAVLVTIQLGFSIH